MTTRASQNGTGAAEMEFEAAHYSSSEMEKEWEEEAYSNPEGYSTPEMEEELGAHETSQYSNPYSQPEMEWEAHETSHYSNPYSSLRWNGRLTRPVITVNRIATPTPILKWNGRPTKVVTTIPTRPQRWKQTASFL